MAQPVQIHRFDIFELDVGNRRLMRAGEPVELGSRYFDALALLVRETGDLVSKDRFMEEVWRGIPVTDEALTQCVRTLRRVLGDDAANPRFIETVPKHGYRFIEQPRPVSDHGEPGGAVRPFGWLAASATFAGAAAGAAGGLFYGTVASTGGASTVLVLTAMVAALGTLAWFIGHWSFAVRNDARYRSRLARVVIDQTPPAVDAAAVLGTAKAQDARVTER